MQNPRPRTLAPAPALLDTRNTLHNIKRLSDVLPDLRVPQALHQPPNPHMAGFNAGREARNAIGECEQCNID